jgi:hypothetical protein
MCDLELMLTKIKVKNRYKIIKCLNQVLNGVIPPIPHRTFTEMTIRHPRIRIIIKEECGLLADMNMDVLNIPSDKAIRV